MASKSKKTSVKVVPPVLTTAASRAAGASSIPVAEPVVVPVATRSTFQVLGVIEMGCQALLLAQVSVPADQIRSLGVLEGRVAPVYRALCRADDVSAFSASPHCTDAVVDGVASYAGIQKPARAMTIFCAVLSPFTPVFLSPNRDLTVVVTFTDGSRSVQTAPLWTPDSPGLLSSLPALRPALPQLAGLAARAGKTDSALGRLSMALSQATSALDNPYAGAFDGIVDGHAEGWVYDIRRPLDRIEVVLMEGERPLAYGMADQFRADLRDACKSDGRVKFSLPVPRRLHDGQPHLLNVAVAGVNVMLPKGPRTFTGPRLFTDPVPEVIEYGVSRKLVAAVAAKLGHTARSSDFELQICRALVQMDNADWRRARTTLEGLSQQLGPLPVIRFYLGVLELKAGNAEEACAVLRSVLQDAPDFVWAHVALADACLASSEADAARKALDAARRLAPGLRAVQSRVQALQISGLLTNAHLLKNESTRLNAIGLCKRAILNDPDNTALTDALRCFQVPGDNGPAVHSMFESAQISECEGVKALRHERLVVSVLLEAARQRSILEDVSP